MRSKENLFRRAAKDDLQQDRSIGNKMEIVENGKTGKIEAKNKAEIRRKILGTRDIVVQSAKIEGHQNKEFFSSRKKFGADQEIDTQVIKVSTIKKFQTDRNIS